MGTLRGADHRKINETRRHLRQSAETSVISAAAGMIDSTTAGTLALLCFSA
jgi:hypothetical protein